MKTVTIKGKEYTPVDERLKAFREEHKDYSLTTQIVEMNQEWVVMQATIMDEKGHILAVGTASEFRNDDNSFVNKTSYIENCETSAWGRALGNLGYGLIGAVASADEVTVAVSQQPAPEKPDFPCQGCKGTNVINLKGTSKKTGNPYDFWKCQDCGFTMDK